MRVVRGSRCVEGEKFHDVDPQFTQLICIVPHKCPIKGRASFLEALEEKKPSLENVGSDGIILVDCCDCRYS